MSTSNVLGGGRRWLAAALVALASGLAYESSARAEEVVYQKHTVLEFGDATIEGDLSRPDGQYLESRKRLRHQRLIKVRETFRAEILKSVQDL
ncbi:MAG: hypothetical protein AAB426_08425 [Myxococcota bacterium]